MTDTPQEIKITGEPTADPQVCKFIVDRPLLDGSYTCRDAESAEGSPLLERLFKIDGISQVMVHNNVLTIAKAGDQEWPVIGKDIGNAIRESLRSDDKPIADDVTTKQPSEEAMARKIEKLFEEHINPQIESHGGWVQLADVEGSTVYLRMGGGCQGCASANATLRMGIEKAIKQVVPEVTEVVDVTDHTAGTNPYYS